MPVVTFVALLVVWEIGVRLLGIPSFLLPGPALIASEAWQFRSQLAGHTAVTLWEAVAGFALTIALGIPLAVFIAGSRFLRNTIYPMIVITQSVPKVAIAPLIVIFLGVGELPKILIAFLVAFFPLVVDTATGLNSVPPELIALSRSLKASRVQEFVKIRFPTAVPFIFSGLKVAVAFSVLGAVVGEFVQADSGLGYLIVVSTSYYKTALAFAAMAILSAMGITLFALVGFIEKRFFPWHSAA